MNRLLIATKNPGKLREFKGLLKNLPLEVVSLKDTGITEDVEETGKTYEENSQKKALFYAKKSGLPALSDDGGLEIKALGGAPGVRSRRWLGHETTDKKLFDHLAKIISKLPKNKRSASFRVAVSFATPEGEVWSTKSEVKGVLAPKPFSHWSRGYPYRSFFYLPKIKKYYHEKDLTKEQTNMYNHRYKALKKLLPIIKKNI